MLALLAAAVGAAATLTSAATPSRTAAGLASDDDGFGGAAAPGACRVATASANWSEFGTRNAYTADGAVHKFSTCDNKGAWAWQSTGNITVEQCAAQAQKLGAKCWDILCPYRFAANCTCPSQQPVAPVRSATTVACVGDSITAGYLSSCGLNYPNQLQALLGEQYAVTNYGVGGRTMFKTVHLPPGDHASYWSTPQYAAALNSSSEIVVLMLGTNDAMAKRWALSGGEFASDYLAMARSFLASRTPQPKLYLMVPPPLYRDGRYNMNQTVINSLFPGAGPSGVRTIADSLKLPASRVIDIYSLFQKQCPVAAGSPGHAPNASDVPCDWIGWCSGVNSTESECDGIDACHPNDVGYGQIAKLVRAAITQ
eukprot:COSAG06_NODE_271_length_18677_cov_157.113360_7_plen_369_part_00